MTKMAAMPIYGKNPLKIFSETSRPNLRTGIQHWRLGPYNVCSDDPGLTLTCFMERSASLHNGFVCLLDFIETIEVYELKVGTFSLISEYMKTYELTEVKFIVWSLSKSLRFKLSCIYSKAAEHISQISCGAFMIGSRIVQMM